MIDKVSIGDVARKVADYRDFRITHEELVHWAREAMMAGSIPPSEVETVMDLLLDISASTPEIMRRAITQHDLLSQNIDLSDRSAGDFR